MEFLPGLLGHLLETIIFSLLIVFIFDPFDAPDTNGNRSDACQNKHGTRPDPMNILLPIAFSTCPVSVSQGLHLQGMDHTLKAVLPDGRIYEDLVYAD